jgi:hypothetical protein
MSCALPKQGQQGPSPALPKPSGCGSIALPKPSGPSTNRPGYNKPKGSGY